MFGLAYKSPALGWQAFSEIMSTQQLLTVGFALVALLELCLAQRLNLAEHRVYRLQAQSVAQLQALQPLEAQHEQLTFLQGLQLGQMDVLVSPGGRAQLLGILDSHSIAHQLLDDNPAASLALDIEPVADANRRSDDYSWQQYHELNDTYQWLHTMAAKYPQVASVFVAGESFEQRQLLGLRIDYGAERANKTAVFLEAGMHAREWISPATATYFAHELLTSMQPALQQLARAYTWYILPHANPDGFVYTHKHNRMWRKTRSPQGKDCYGSDPNRNWAFHWREVGASSEPCSETYAGAKAFSERETQTLAEYLQQLPEPIFMYIALHSFSQLLLYPYGHTSALPANHEQVERVYAAAVAAVRQRYGTRYTGGNVYDAIYPASGSSMDWAYGQLGAKYAFTYELRPSGNSFWTGFRLPATQIIPTGQETTDSLIAMVNTAAAMEQRQIK